MATSEGKPPTLCQICDTTPSKYLCPRCGIPYCSLVCYKSEQHMRCSESFYKDCVLENIKSEESLNPDGAKKMNEALQRFHQQYNSAENPLEDEDELEELDSDDDEPLDRRLAGVDLNNAEDVWEHLTEEERREFQSLARNTEEAGKVIPEWVPWWLQPVEKKLITELQSDESNPEEGNINNAAPKLNQHQPDILTPIPRMSDLTKVKPNEHVAQGLLNVVSAFVWTARHFNGDMYDSGSMIEISSSIIYLSSFLKRGGLFKNIEHALADVPLNASQMPALSEGGDTIQSSLNRDVWIIVKGPQSTFSSSGPTKLYLLAALSECYNVFRIALKEMKHKANATEKQSESRHSKLQSSAGTFSKLFAATPSVPPVDVKLVGKSKRKVLYLLAFANEHLEQYMSLSDLQK